MKKTTPKTNTESKKVTKKTGSEDKQKSLIAPNTVIKITVPKKDAEVAYKKALNKLAKKLKIDGFRKGNVPAKIAEEHLNPQQIIEDALQTVVPGIYTAELKKSDRKPLTYPEFNPISLKKGEDWVLEAFIAERPVINLKSYKAVVKKSHKAATKEVDKQIKAAKDAEIAKEKTAKDTKKGDSKKDSDKSKNTDKAKADSKTEAPKKPTGPSEEEKKNFSLQFIYKDLIEEIKPEIQELIVKEEVKYDLDNLNHRLKQMNITFEKFLEHRKMTFEQLSNELAAGALGRLQVSFIIDEIAKTEKITVDQSDLDAEFTKITDEKIRKQQQSDPRYTDMMKQTILRRKVADYILTIK